MEKGGAEGGEEGLLLGSWEFVVWRSRGVEKGGAEGLLLGSWEFVVRRSRGVEKGGAEGLLFKVVRTCMSDRSKM